jgi:glycosyltransferase involved in cell wall biosynthesis
MRIIYIHQYFVTPEEGGAVRSYHLAKGMVAAGMEVDMITAHNEDYYDLKIIEGVKVHYLPVRYESSFGFGQRVRAFLGFVRKAKEMVNKLPRPDLLYITSTPLTTGLIGIWAKMKFAVPYIFEVRDLWPEAPIQLGVVRNSYLISLLYKLEESIYKHALRIVALSPGIKNHIDGKTKENKTFLIPNFVDTEFFQPQPDPTIKSIKPKTISYAGAVGRVNALHEFVDLAAQAHYYEKNWQFNIMGKGSDLEKIQRLAKERDLKNLTFIPFASKHEVKRLMESSDMMFISFAQHPVLKTSSPNKFFDALAMGKPVIVNHQGWIRELVHNHKIGVHFDALESEVSFERLVEFIENEKECKAASRNARALAENHFSADIAVKRVLNVLDPANHPLMVNAGVYIRTA